jgi:hypothetical protein
MNEKLPKWICSKYIGLLLTIYIFSWTASYIFVMGLDLRYYIEYLVIAWSFRGGEIPAFIWFFSILLTLGLGWLSLIILKRMKAAKSE